MFRELTLINDEVTLNLAQADGSGPPLILLHGVLRRWSDFLPLVPALSIRWQLLGLDFRGHGKSGRVPGRYRVVDYVRDATAALNQGASEPAVVYGHSLGAMVALAAAAQLPDRVRAIVLEDPPFGTLGAQIHATMFLSQFQGIQRLLETPKPVDQIARELTEVTVVSPDGRTRFRLGDVRDPAAIRFQAQCLSQVDRGVLDPILSGSWLEEFDWASLAGQVRCPTLVLQADTAAGGMLMDRDAHQLRELVPHALCVPFRGTGHLIHGTATEATLRVVGSFLESLLP